MDKHTSCARSCVCARGARYLQSRQPGSAVCRRQGRMILSHSSSAAQPVVRERERERGRERKWSGQCKCWCLSTRVCDEALAAQRHLGTAGTSFFLSWNSSMLCAMRASVILSRWNVAFFLIVSLCVCQCFVCVFTFMHRCTHTSWVTAALYEIVLTGRCSCCYLHRASTREAFSCSLSASAFRASKCPLTWSITCKYVKCKHVFHAWMRLRLKHARALPHTHAQPSTWSITVWTVASSAASAACISSAPLALAASVTEVSRVMPACVFEVSPATGWKAMASAVCVLDNLSLSVLAKSFS